MPKPIKNAIEIIVEKSVSKWAVFFFVIYLIFIFIFIATRQLRNSVLLASYGILVTAFILSRFLLAFFYEPVPDNSFEPSVTFIVPAMNEGESIKRTLEKIYEVNYPKEKIEVITINDGSTDNTLEYMRQVKQEHVDMMIISYRKNRGKKQAMARGIKRARGQILVFIDSDSFVQPDSIRPLVKYFSDPKVGAVSGRTDVHNWKKNILTRMQAARYMIAFDVEKSAEGLFGCVTCCSGCFSAYRRDYVLEVLDEWVNQKTLGIDCHYGDDRSLTNYLLKKYQMKYSPEARASTIAPETTRQFLKQQLRWKKSWITESFRAGLFIWRKHPLMAMSFYSELLLTLISPFILIRAMIWDPATNHYFPLFYLVGFLLASFLYGFYYYIKTGSRSWVCGMLAAWFYALVMVWQMPHALLSLRDAKWGTR
jgi:hyaluronan synthase